MIEEIINLFEEQNSLYNEILSILNNKANNNSDYKIALDKVKDKLKKIDELKQNLERLKNEYIKEKGLSDFIGNEIVKVEEKEKYRQLKQVIEELGDKIITVKKLQDNFIVNINKKIFEAPKPLSAAYNTYTQGMKDKENSHKKSYIDKKR